MEFFINCYKSEFYKRKRSIFYPLHIILPLIYTLGLTLILYSKKGYIDELYIGNTFFQVISLVLPLIIALVCGFISNQEKDINYQIILSSPNRRISLLAQIVMLITMNIFSILLSFIFISFCMKYFLGVELIYIGLFLKACFFIIIGVILIYIFQLFIGYTLGAGVCCIVGFLGIIISALSITNLGDGIWYILPQSWSIRLTSMVLNSDVAIQNDFSFGIKIILLLTLISLFLVLLWISKWQGRKNQE